MSPARLNNAAKVRRIAAVIGATAVVAMGATAAVAAAEQQPLAPRIDGGATTTSTAPPTVPMTPSASPVVKAAPYGKS
jgi:hypothetical protein